MRKTMIKHIRTKIVCTIGPASREPEMLEKLIQAGMNVARLNFSHASQEEHGENIDRIRAVSKAVGKPVAIMTDLQGPKIRVDKVVEEGVLIKQGEQVKLTAEDVVGHREDVGPICATIPLQFKSLPRDVKPGEPILIDDGLIELVVLETSDLDILCEVVTGGVIKGNKGINLPGTNLAVPAITEKDKEDLAFALSKSVDLVALSFVRQPEDVHQLKAFIADCCAEGEQAQVIAKIEKPQALEHIEEIIAAADGIMVARGDLGIEIPAERVPVAQKRLIGEANKVGKPVITATQMLDSMIRNPRPTRAEASDVANAILDGTDAIMLSGETAVGKYPLEAVRTMVQIASEIEAAFRPDHWKAPPHVDFILDDVTDAVSHATCEMAYSLHAAAIITATASGKTARSVARYRPLTPIVAVTPNQSTQHQLLLSWGVIALQGQPVQNTDRLLRHSIEKAYEAGLIQPGDRVVLTAGVANNMPGTTNLMRVEQVPDLDGEVE
jgi:pyruvate kinase